MWRANSKAWVTREIFIKWINDIFGLQVHTYLKGNGLPMKTLLILDNAPGHPSNLHDEILENFRFIKVLYLPPNTTPILPPMDQQVISNFKKLYIKHMFRRCFNVLGYTNLTLPEFWKGHFNIVNSLNIIDVAWQGVTKRTLNSAWKKLWPECVSHSAFSGFATEAPEVADIVSLSKSLGLVVDDDDINKLVDEDKEEMTTEELLLLQEHQYTNVTEKIKEPEIEKNLSEVLLTSDIKEMLAM